MSNPALSCFADDLRRDALDRTGFTFGHKLLGHPALSLENLARVLPALPKEQVFYSSGLVDRKADFDRAHLDHQNGLSLEETIETIRSSDSYIMVRKPETDPSFSELFRALLGDVEALIRAREAGREALDPMLYLFIASPNSLTPFHVDRYSTILMQFRGDKEVCVFPPRDARVASADDCDAFMAYAPGRRPVWRPEAEALGTSFQFSPGDALHIPFMAGHYVRNGANDVSISMSIIFNTRETARLSDAMRWNHYLRRKAGRFGFEPSPVGTSAQRDAAKALMWRSKQRVTRLVGVGH